MSRTADRRRIEKMKQIQRSLGLFEEEEPKKEEQGESPIDYTKMISFTQPKEPDMIKLIDLDLLVPAPYEWNFYKPLPDDTMLELIDSIARNGLQQPIVVWEQQDGTYMILAGHNRKRAFQMLYNSTGDEKYKKIPCKVYSYPELDRLQAKEIVIDTNWIVRTLSPVEKAKSIVNKIQIVNQARGRRKDGLGRTRDIVAAKYNIDGRTVERYRKLLDLIPEFLLLIDSRKLSLKAGERLAGFDQETQRWIYTEFYDSLSNKRVEKIHSGMTRDEIREIMTDIKTSPEPARVIITIPYGFERELMKYIDRFLEEHNVAKDSVKISVL